MPFASNWCRRNNNWHSTHEVHRAHQQPRHHGNHRQQRHATCPLPQHTRRTSSRPPVLHNTHLQLPHHNIMPTDVEEQGADPCGVDEVDAVDDTCTPTQHRPFPTRAISHHQDPPSMRRTLPTGVTCHPTPKNGITTGIIVTHAGLTLSRGTLAQHVPTPTPTINHTAHETTWTNMPHSATDLASEPNTRLTSRSTPDHSKPDREGQYM